MRTLEEQLDAYTRARTSWWSRIWVRIRAFVTRQSPIRVVAGDARRHALNILLKMGANSGEPATKEQVASAQQRIDAAGDNRAWREALEARTASLPDAPQKDPHSKE